MGADCNDARGSVTTPFYTALMHADVQIVKLLLDYGGDLTGMDWMRKPVYFYSLKNPNVNVLQFVLDQGIDITCNNTNNEWTALHYAVTCSALQYCRILLSWGAMVNRRTSSGNTPLALAVSDCTKCTNTVCVRVHIVDTLLRHGANVSDEVQGKTIFEIAKEKHSCAKVVALLIRNIAKMTCQDLSVSDPTQRMLEKPDSHRIFYQSCLQEIEYMKND